MLELKRKCFYDFIFLQIIFVINFVQIQLGTIIIILADGVQPLQCQLEPFRTQVYQTILILKTPVSVLTTSEIVVYF